MSTSNGLIDRVDSIAIVEAAYVEAANNQQWLRGLLDAVGQGVEHVASMAAVLVTAEPPRVVDIVGSHGLQPKDLAQAIQCDVGKYTNVWRMSPLSMASTQSSTMVNQLGSTRLLRTHALEPTDYLAFTAFDPQGDAVILSFALPQTLVPTAAEQRRATRLSAHISAGYRLRKRHHRAAASSVGGAAAVLEPGGKLLHAEGEAQGKSAREALRQAAIRIDQARSKAGKANLDAALESWKGLVSGRWSLVDVFESDGRRLLVARDNELLPPPAERLSLRERQVVAYAASGDSQKLIAYSLGISASLVSANLASACRKLGVASRAQLAQVLGWRQGVVENDAGTNTAKREQMQANLADRDLGTRP